MYSGDPIIEVKLDIILDNYRQLQNVAGGAEVAAAVKADCYGLGADFIAPLLAKAGCEHFFVANIDEGIILRKKIVNDKAIYVLNGVFIDSVDALLQYKLIPVINHAKQLELWHNYARNLQQKLPVVFHLNTGMNRLGMSVEEFTACVSHSEVLKELDVKLVMSHFAASDEPADIANIQQLQLFKELTDGLVGIKRSMCNSGGIFMNKMAHFDLVRPGAALYGLLTHPDAHKYVKNPVSLYAPIIQIHQLKSGDQVGYNGTFIADKNMRIATIPIGYADGYMRSLSSKGCVYIGENQVKVVGRVSMDLVTIDITDLPMHECFLGQKVEIIGKHNTPDNLAQLAGTIGYEILTSLGKRYKRVYL
jgi:alanine racemase